MVWMMQYVCLDSRLIECVAEKHASLKDLLQGNEAICSNPINVSFSMVLYSCSMCKYILVIVQFIGYKYINRNLLTLGFF